MMGILCCALAACADSSDEGTYHVTFALNTQDSSPLDTLPSKLSWPSATDLTLRFENGRSVRLEIFGEQVDTDPTIVDDMLLLTFGSKFRVTVEDTVACPQTYPPSLHGSTALYFRNGHVQGRTADDEGCSLDGDIPYARFFFDVTGDRVSE
ncbi:MAG TPA: hypothetical protein VHW23_39240 [Kofleriaceae bacterium]|nr:hypothetical protein [Kofleriaceae bacterium]